jgi:flagellin
MAFDINTNIASLQAQQYLRVNSDFQAKTINRVTSGLRIISSGDDAAGLAIANGYRSDQSVLTQGIRNANDGLSNLQTIDGGMNNISMLLDRARTLATQSASGTFNGNRALLNSEFTSVLAEIDRQSQSIGLNQGGTFAKSLSVFIGGGRGTSATDTNTQDVINNGSVSVDLSKSTVDSKSLGMAGLQALGNGNPDVGETRVVDLGTGSAKTSVAQILADATNTNTEAVTGYTNFYFTGPGFSDGVGATGNLVKVSVNLTGVTDTSTLATAINTAIQNAGNSANQQATAFKNANITATVVTNSSGQQQLGFNSSNSVFQVEAGDRVANAFLGNFTSASPSSADGQSAYSTVTSATTMSTLAATESVKLRFIGAGLTNGYYDLAVTLPASTGTAQATAINTAIAADSTLKTLGITASGSTAASLVFTNPAGTSLEVQAAGDTANALGLGAYLKDAGGNFNYTTIAGTAAVSATAADTQHLIFAIGNTTVDLGAVAVGASEATALQNINNAIATAATGATASAKALRAADITAADSAGNVALTSASGASFRLSIGTGAARNVFGFATSNASDLSGLAAASVNTDQIGVNSGGAQESVNSSSNADVFTFKGLRVAGDTQTITLTAVDTSGSEHTLNVGLTTANAYSLDQALSTINLALQQSNDSTLKNMYAAKEQNLGDTAEGIRFLSPVAFKVSLGATPLGNGVSDNTGAQGGPVFSSTTLAGGSTAAIDTQAGASSAVTALSNAVAALGSAQAVVGKGENDFNYAINLAQSQLTNLAAAESRIRDADLAAEAANLTKAQILMQAGTAALAQANSAPQAVLALLK